MSEMEGLDVTACERCDELVACRSRIVNGTGPADADLLFVGEAPGEHEDERGEPRRVLVCVHPAATLYDPSQRETFAATLERAAEFTDESSGQSRLGEF